MVTHQDCLNVLLALSCGAPVSDGWSQYRIDLCCAHVLIEARCVAKPPTWEGPGDSPKEWTEAFKFEIRSIRMSK